jgi:hypothetical protein
MKEVLWEHAADMATKVDNVIVNAVEEEKRAETFYGKIQKV